MSEYAEEVPAAPDNITRVWTANDILWNTRIVPLVLEPLERAGGLHTTGAWQHIVAITFGRTQKTFEAIQVLMNPSRPRRLWDDAFILTRTHYETFVTLEWIKLDSERRAQLVEDEFALKQAHFLELMGDTRNEVSSERQGEILRERDEVLRRHGRGARTIRLLPSLEERVRDIATALRAKHPHLQWEYDFYYRDVSAFAHPSGWGLVLSLHWSPEEVPMVEASVRNGYNAVFCNGGWFFRIFKCWNSVFGRLSAEMVRGWEREWAREAGIA
jgi:hypothetical protein